MYSEDFLMHYGVKRRSGRYPWGSGDNPYQHSGDFLSRVEGMKKQGMTDAQIAEAISTDGYSLTSTDLRVYMKVARDERRALDVARAKSLKEDGHNTSEIGRIMGKNESTIRSLLDADTEKRMNEGRHTADNLKKLIEEKGIIDVGAGVEHELHISRGKLEEALIMLEAEGYPRYGIGVKNSTNANTQTTVAVICPKGTTYSDVYKNQGKIASIKDYHFEDGGKTLVEDTFRYPASLDSKRIYVRYAEDGGTENDGVIQLRRGVEDISLGESAYGQVRILVDGTHYMKGMAVYSDEIPDGYDVIYNSNKKKGSSFDDVFKEVKPEHKDTNNPFGTYIKGTGQREYIDPKTGEKKLSVINKVREEGEWDTWSRNLPSQFLSKQNVGLVKKQLNLSYSDRLAEYEEIRSLTNPTVKRKLLNDFADDCDAASVHLKAAALPGQSSKVILPSNKLADNEIYAPTYKNGDKVALIRYPHAGTFEIPVLTVNNNNKEVRSIYGNLQDAVAINANVAGHLSGADFDGDTVTVIPLNGKTKITAKPQLKALEGFEPKDAYGWDKKVSASESKDGQDHYYRNGVEISTNKNYQRDMGDVSNLITDMTLKGAPDEEVAKAVKYSMVIIDTKKHPLDYKACKVDCDIDTLKNTWQGHVNPETGRWSTGAGTLISQAKSPVEVPKRKGNPNINPETGEKTYKEITYVDKNGVVRTKPSKEVHETYTETKVYKNGNVKTIEKERTTSSTKMAETKDAFTLSSGNPKEEEYAKYANNLKALANQARKEAINTGRLQYSSESKTRYSVEVASLNAKLNRAELNRPRERQAQIIANAKVKAITESNPDLKGDKKMLGKIKNQELDIARKQVGASGKDVRIDITPKEWEAIQAGAISDSKLSTILNKADPDKVREYATPRNKTVVSDAKKAQIKAYSASGYTIAEIAEKLGYSSSTVSKYLK